jgi:hypothetical protein
MSDDLSTTFADGSKARMARTVRQLESMVLGSVAALAGSLSRRP